MYEAGVFAVLGLEAVVAAVIRLGGILLFRRGSADWNGSSRKLEGLISFFSLLLESLAVMCIHYINKEGPQNAGKM